jgi:uncharacterized protein YciI
VPLFVMIGHDGPDGAERRDQHRAEHVAHLEALDREGRIVLAGTPRNDNNDASVGAVIIFKADSLEDARDLVSRDPFVLGGVFEALTVAPFKHAYPKEP